MSGLSSSANAALISSTVGLSGPPPHRVSKPVFVENGELLFGSGVGRAVQYGQKSSVAGRARPQSRHVICEVVKWQRPSPDEEAVRVQALDHTEQSRPSSVPPRQDPSLGRDVEERKHIRMYRKAVESAAAGKLDDSFERLDKMGAIVACGIGEQADKLADEYLRLAEQNASAVVVSQTWGEVHRVNSRVRDALKGKGLLGAADSALQALERIDLTNAQKRDERFYPPDAVIVFNQKVRDAEPGAKGKLAGILKTSVLVEVGGKFVTVSNRLLDRLTVCQARALSVANGDRLHLKANRKLASGGRVTNGELDVTSLFRAS